MAVNEFKTEQYLQKARERVTMAFEDKPVFDKYLQLLILEQMDVQEVIREMMQERSVDTAVGKQLDIIGDIVGQPRVLVDIDTMPFFGFEGNPASESYGDLTTQNVGGYYHDLNQPLFGVVELNDEQYRLFIKAKIMKNITRSTPEDIVSFIRFVLGAARVNVFIDYGAQQVLLLVSDDLDQFKRNLLTYFTEEPFRSYFVPKALGVGIEFGTIPTAGFFSFIGVPDAQGYGSLGETGGGVYASII